MGLAWASYDLLFSNAGVVWRICKLFFYLNSFSFIPSPNPFFNLRVWRWNRMDIISTIKHFFHELITFKYRKSYLWIISLRYILMSLNFWITILNLRSYCLTLKTMSLFLWALLIT